jgi:hypothetical protein
MGHHLLLCCSSTKNYTSPTSRPSPPKIRAVIVVILLALALGFDVGVDAVDDDDLVRAASLVLANQGAPVRVPRNWIS